MKVYLDNCCYNRPYDDQSYLRISLESQAKLFVQHLIRAKKLDLVTSYVLVLAMLLVLNMQNVIIF